MLVGKRPRPPTIRRTTSMSSGLTLDLNDNIDNHNMNLTPKSNPHILQQQPSHSHSVSDPSMPANNTTITMLSPTNTNTNTNQTIIQPHFLGTCGRCKRCLPSGRDIYMYRGDTAFCSLECREKQMKEEQRKDKRKLQQVVTNNNKQEADLPHHPHASSSSNKPAPSIAAA